MRFARGYLSTHGLGNNWRVECRGIECLENACQGRRDPIRQRSGTPSGRSATSSMTNTGPKKTAPTPSRQSKYVTTGIWGGGGVYVCMKQFPGRAAWPAFMYETFGAGPPPHKKHFSLSFAHPKHALIFLLRNTSEKNENQGLMWSKLFQNPF